MRDAEGVITLYNGVLCMRKDCGDYGFITIEELCRCITNCDNNKLMTSMEGYEAV